MIIIIIQDYHIKIMSTYKTIFNYNWFLKFIYLYIFITICHMILLLTFMETKQKRCKIPILLDLVGDHVVSRTLTALIFFLVFVFTTFLIIGAGDSVFCNFVNKI